MKVLVLSSPGCTGCGDLEEMLRSLNVPYKVVDVTHSPKYLERYPVMTAPGLVVDGRLVHCGVPAKDHLARLLA